MSIGGRGIRTAAAVALLAVAVTACGDGDGTDRAAAGEPIAEESDRVDVQLWATDGDPVLLVSLDRGLAVAPRNPTVVDDAGEPPEPPSDVDGRRRTAGDRLFEEQGTEMHLPDATWSLMPTLPTFGGTGGSTSVIAAEDADAAVRALLDEAQASSDYGEVTEPEATDADGMRVIQAAFVISAGGWGFHVVAVEAPGDPYATLYITSAAD